MRTGRDLTLIQVSKCDPRLFQFSRTKTRTALTFVRPPLGGHRIVDYYLIKTSWSVCANAFTTPTRAFRVRGSCCGTPQGILGKQGNNITYTRAGARLSGFAACRKLSMWRATRVTPCLIALALARFPLGHSPRLFPLLAINAKSVDTASRPPPYFFFLSHSPSPFYSDRFYILCFFLSRLFRLIPSSSLFPSLLD